MESASVTSPADEVEPSLPALGVRGLSKHFGATRALRDVDIDIVPGTIHGLVGGNGSGKSTLIKTLAGVHQADAGMLLRNGISHDARDITPQLSRSLGLRFVHQQPSTFADMTVSENLAIGAHGFLTDPVRRIRWGAQRRQARSLLERFGIQASPDSLLRDLNPASQTMVSIARALQDQAPGDQGILILDEPTASLPLREVELLLSALKRYASEGQTIVYVSHRLEEVTSMADAVTVLRDGELVTTTNPAPTQARLVELITGRTLDELTHRKHATPAAARTVLSVDHLSSGPVRDVSFSLREGEIVGIAGLLGSGRSSILRSLFGDRPPRAGTIALDGATRAVNSPRAAMRAGIAFVPEDRNGLAAFAEMSVTENLGIAATDRFFRRGRLRHRIERRDAAQLAADFRVKAQSLEQPLGSLSGGNAQKVILARWLRREPRLILLDEPTQGVDFGARSDIWNLVMRAVRERAAALVVSSDFEELASVCDRVLILRAGEITAELGGEDVTEHNIDRLVLMGGHS